jgi:hypothetical protein
MHKNKALVSIVLILGLVIVVGLGVLVYGLYKKANNPSFNFFQQTTKKKNIPAKTSNETIEKNRKFKKKISIPLTNGEWVSNMTTSQNKIIVHITNKYKNDRLLILDATNGSIISHVEFKYRQ